MRSIISVIMTAAVLLSVLTACGTSRKASGEEARAVPTQTAAAQQTTRPAQSAVPQAGLTPDRADNAAQDIGDAAGNAAERVGNAAGNIVEGVGDAVGDAARGAGNAVNELVDDMGDTDNGRVTDSDGRLENDR